MKDIQATLLLIGEGPLRSKLEGVVSECGVSDRVHILGKVPDTTPYYQATDIFVLPSIEPAEAFGIVQLEAMAYGKAVVNTNIPSAVPGVSLHEVTGLTVSPRDAGALAKAINTLLYDEPLRDRYGAAGRVRVEQEFTNRVMTERTMALYERLL
jgi:rhamnosyl/mannosyltransferase